MDFRYPHDTLRLTYLAGGGKVGLGLFRDSGHPGHVVLCRQQRPCLLGDIGQQTQITAVAHCGVGALPAAHKSPIRSLGFAGNARDCAIRIIKGAYGFSPASLRQFGVLTAVHRDPSARIISIGYYALIRDVPVPDDDPDADRRWVSIDELSELAFDHRRMFDMAMDSLRKSVHFEPAAFELMPEVFSLPELQKLYETILGTTFDRRNFQKKNALAGHNRRSYGRR